MKKAAFVVGPALGHAGRMYEIAQELVALGGWRVSFLTPASAEFLPEFAGERFEVIKLAEGSGLEEVPGLTFTEGLDDAFSRGGYDVAALDLNPLRWLSVARPPPCPAAFITNVFLTRAAQLSTAQQRPFRRKGARINDIRRQRGLKLLSTVFDLYDADRVLLIDPEPIASQFAPLPENYRICGACFWTMVGALPAKLNHVSEALLISMGSTGREPIDAGLLRQIVGQLGCRSVICVGTGLPPLDGVDVPVHRYPRLPLDKVLARSKAVLSHGGAGSTYQALAAGVPVIVLPTGTNHALLGDIIETLGIGIHVREPSALPAAKSNGFGRLQANARSFAAGMAVQNGPRATAMEIMELAQ